jgi:hypothetical protein
MVATLWANIALMTALVAAVCINGHW